MKSSMSKNTQTLTYKAAQTLKAAVKLGLTGTPIENRLEELKALFDQTLPGYLGTDGDFRDRYIKTKWRGHRLDKPPGAEPTDISFRASPPERDRSDRTAR